MIERLAGHELRILAPVAALLLGAACGTPPTDLAPLPVTAQVNLSPTAFTLVGGTGITGAVEFPTADVAREYLVVAQQATPNAVSATNYTLGVQASAVAEVQLTQLAQRPDPGLAFHAMLRRREAELARMVLAQPSLRAAPPVRTAPPTVGDKRTFKVCANTNCDVTKNVTATAQFVGVHAAIFVEDTLPANGFTPADIAGLGSQFDTDLYPVDSGRFGAESDIDGNGMVIVLLSKQINALVPKPGCSNGFITGYFFSGDLLPAFATKYNNGEVFYGMVPDPTGSVSCAYSTSYVRNVLSVTFIHEFQHMISFNQHVLLRGGDTEVLWLNEAMSHLAEELGGLHYDSLGNQTQASRFFVGNLYNASNYMADPASVTVVATDGNGSLAERGAGWLLVRYLVDRVGPDAARQLVQTNLTGGANLQSVGGMPFESILGRWMLAMYVNDLPGFSAPPELTYSRWKFRTTFASLHAQDPSNFPFAFPLQPDSGTGATAFLTGTVNAGTGAYLRVKQAAGDASFALTFRGPNGDALAANRVPQLAVVRVH